MSLKLHQKECKNKIKNHLIENNNALIKIFCGGGKSFIIYDCLLDFGNNLS